MLLKQVTKGQSFVKLIKKEETNIIGQGGFLVHVEKPKHIKGLNYKTFDEAYQSYEDEINQCYKKVIEIKGVPDYIHDLHS